MNKSGIERAIGYTFQDERLLRTAFTHRSYLNESREKTAVSYERLEFLGDAILGFAAAEHLYKSFAFAEGELTRMRAALVREQALARVADALRLGESLLLGKGEQESGRTKPSILSDVVEAIIGAIYLDGGMQASLKFIHKFVLTESAMPNPTISDYKSMLQELVQRDKDAVLTYRVRESGPDHRKEFESEALINGRSIGIGKGRTKKESEQAAAADALEKYQSIG